MVTLAFAVIPALSEQIPFDARFLQDGERSVRGWKFNAVDSYQPFGDVNAVMSDGLPGVRLTSKGKPTSIYLEEVFPAKSGEEYVLQARLRGKGRASIGFFAYGAHWAWKGGYGTNVFPVVAMDCVPQPVEARYVVTDGIETVRPVLTAAPGADIEMFDVRVFRIHKVDQAQNPTVHVRQNANGPNCN